MISRFFGVNHSGLLYIMISVWVLHPLNVSWNMLFYCFLCKKAVSKKRNAGREFYSQNNTFSVVKHVFLINTFYDSFRLIYMSPDSHMKIFWKEYRGKWPQFQTKHSANKMANLSDYRISKSKVFEGIYLLIR